MNDRHPEIARLVRERYARMTPQERFLIGVRMFETARAMAVPLVARCRRPMTAGGDVLPVGPGLVRRLSAIIRRDPVRPVRFRTPGGRPLIA